MSAGYSKRSSNGGWITLPRGGNNCPGLDPCAGLALLYLAGNEYDSGLFPGSLQSDNSSSGQFPEGKDTLGRNKGYNRHVLKKRLKI